MVQKGTQQLTINLLESILPVTFSRFNATASQCRVALTFSTAFEQNNSHFEMEWSSNGRDFVKIATVASKGNSSIEQTYAYTHNNPAAGNNYYRIKQVDLNGTITYSQVINTSSDCSRVKIAAYPNPMVNQLNVSGLQPGSVLQLIDANGKTVLSARAVQSNLILNTTQLPKGNYYLIAIAIDEQKQTIKLIK
jgi:trimeric autotransporter adhesin